MTMLYWYNVLCQYLGEIPTNYFKNMQNLCFNGETIWTSLASLQVVENHYL